MLKQVENYQVPLGAKIVDAMVSMERSSAEIALVIDDDGRLAGTMTDGDIRRALLGGFSLDSPLAPHFQRKFTSVPPGTSRTAVLDLMQARTLNQIGDPRNPKAARI